jgi:hypothetical protein
VTLQRLAARRESGRIHKHAKRKFAKWIADISRIDSLNLNTPPAAFATGNTNPRTETVVPF